MAVLLAGRKHQAQTLVLAERLSRWCTNAKHGNRLRFLRVDSCSQAGPGRLSATMIRV